MNTRENMGQSLVCFLLAGILLFAAQPHVHAGNWPVTPKDIRIKPGSDKWFEDNGKYPYLVGVYDSSPFSNFWGDPGKEFDPNGSRASNPVTHPCANGFLWSNYLDAMATHGMTALRAAAIPFRLDDPKGSPYKHYNPYPFPWKRTDANKRYEPGKLETESQVNFNYLHSKADPDLMHPDANYFKWRVRRFCKEAKARKIYVILNLQLSNADYLPYDPGNEKCKRYINALLKETMDLGNVLYEINWEAGNGEWLKYWANYVKGKLAAAGRPKNLIIVNQDTRPCIDLRSPEYTIIGHHRQHKRNAPEGGCHQGGVLQSRQYGKPVIFTEDFNYGQGHNEPTADELRHRMWFSFVTGVHYLWYDWMIPEEKGPPINFYTPLVRAAESLVKFLKTVDPPFWTMSVNDSLASGSNNWVLADPGHHYIVYFSNGVGSGTVMNLQGGPFKARWFNPEVGSTGEFVGGEFDAPANGAFSPPGGTAASDKLVLYIYES